MAGRQSREPRLRDKADLLIANFETCLAVFSSQRPFSGPSLYFHWKTVDHIRRHRNLEQALSDSVTHDLLYATLASWGMHRMGSRGSKLAEYSVFSESLTRATFSLAPLQDLALDAASEADVPQIATSLWGVIEELRVSATASRLVAGTKVLHHLLPDLVPPMDRQYTARFFYGDSGKALYIGEQTAFREMFGQLARVARESRPLIDRYLATPGGYMATGPTKAIDNAIVGHVIEHGV